MRTATMRRIAVAAATAAAAAACTAPHAAQAAAGAGTITYILGGNVWLTTPDGKTTRQLTKDGATKPWQHPAMAPDGSVYAVQGMEIVHLAPGGETLSRVTPPRLIGPGGVETRQVEPEWVAPSPDGTRVAWGSDDYACSEADPTCRFATISGIIDADLPTAVSKYGQAPSLRHPMWITGSRLLGTENSNSFWANLWDVGSEPVRWFESYDQLGLVWDLREPDVAPNRKLIAMVALRPNQRGLIVISRSQTDLATGTPAIPPPLCGITETNRIDASPTWSPDGLELAYADAKGIQVNTWTKEIEGEADCVTPEPRTIAPAGAKSPDWGAAEPLKPTPPPPPPPPPVDQGGGGTPPGGTPAGGTPPNGGTGGTTPPGGVSQPRCVVPKVKPGAQLAPLQKRLASCKVVVVRQTSRTVKKGRVIKVSRKAGTRLPRGATVKVYVSKGRR